MEGRRSVTSTSMTITGRAQTPVFRHKVSEQSVSLIPVEVIDLAVNPDRLHLFISAYPQLPAHKIVKRFKGRSSHMLRIGSDYVISLEIKLSPRANRCIFLGHRPRFGMARICRLLRSRSLRVVYHSAKLIHTL